MDFVLCEYHRVRVGPDIVLAYRVALCQDCAPLAQRNARLSRPFSAEDLDDLIRASRFMDEASEELDEALAADPQLRPAAEVDPRLAPLLGGAE